MARRERKVQAQNSTKSESVQERGGGKKVNARTSRLTARRERKFRRHKVEIVERSSTVRRVIRGNDEAVHFKFMILAGRQRVGEATTMRYALKRAHQHCKMLEENTKRAKRK